MSTIHLDGSKSFSNLGLPLTYLWSFSSLPNGSATTLSSTTTSTVSFTPDIAGVYNVKLIVNDGTTSSTATYSVNTLKLLSITGTSVVTNNTSGIYIVSGNGHNIGTISSLILPFGITGTFDWNGYTWSYSGSDGSYIPHAPIVPYATLDPIHLGSRVSLSGGNLTLTCTGTGNNGCCISTISKSSGKWYWEVTITTADASTFSEALGAYFAIPDIASLDTFVGSSGDGYGYRSYNDPSPASYFLRNNSGSAYGTTYAQGDVIGIALDATAGDMEFYKNGVSQGVALSGATGNTWWAGVSALNPTPSVINSVVTANFGSTPFVYSPPVGYNSGLYS